MNNFATNQVKLSYRAIYRFWEQRFFILKLTSPEKIDEQTRPLSSLSRRYRSPIIRLRRVHFIFASACMCACVYAPEFMSGPKCRVSEISRHRFYTCDFTTRRVREKIRRLNISPFVFERMEQETCNSFKNLYLITFFESGSIDGSTRYFRNILLFR